MERVPTDGEDARVVRVPVVLVEEPDDAGRPLQRRRVDEHDAQEPLEPVDGPEDVLELPAQGLCDDLVPAVPGGPGP